MNKDLFMKYWNKNCIDCIIEQDKIDYLSENLYEVFDKMKKNQTDIDIKIMERDILMFKLKMEGKTTAYIAREFDMSHYNATLRLKRIIRLAIKFMRNEYNKSDNIGYISPRVRNALYSVGIKDNRIDVVYYLLGSNAKSFSECYLKNVGKVGIKELNEYFEKEIETASKLILSKINIEVLNTRIRDMIRNGEFDHKFINKLMSLNSSDFNFIYDFSNMKISEISDILEELKIDSFESLIDMEPSGIKNGTFLKLIIALSYNKSAKIATELDELIIPKINLYRELIDTINTVYYNDTFDYHVAIKKRILSIQKTLHSRNIKLRLDRLFEDIKFIEDNNILLDPFVLKLAKSINRHKDINHIQNLLIFLDRNIEDALNAEYLKDK